MGGAGAELQKETDAQKETELQKETENQKDSYALMLYKSRNIAAVRETKGDKKQVLQVRFKNSNFNFFKHLLLTGNQFISNK